MKKEIKKQIEKKEKRLIDYGWVLKITIMAFSISIVFSLISEATITNVNIYVAILILLVFIIIGILFDMVGVAVTSADAEPFHSMSSRKVSGAKTAVKLIKNAEKVSCFCNDVIGDICGIISGAVGASITGSIANILNLPLFISSLIVTGLIASLMIGGKAISKSIAINKGNEILYKSAKLIDLFIKNK